MMGTIKTEYIFPKGISMEHVLMSIKFIRQTNHDKQMICKQLSETPRLITYEVTHKMPDILRVVFKVPHIVMQEIIDTSDKSNKITSAITRLKNENNTIHFETNTKYVRLGSPECAEIPEEAEAGQVRVTTQIKVSGSFSIPEALKPVVELWAKKKTKKIRKMECKFAKQIKTNMNK